MSYACAVRVNHRMQPEADSSTNHSWDETFIPVSFHKAFWELTVLFVRILKTLPRDGQRLQ